MSVAADEQVAAAFSIDVGADVWPGMHFVPAKRSVKHVVDWGRCGEAAKADSRILHRVEMDHVAHRYV